MDFTALQNTLRHFAAEREWQTFHTPKNLAMALMVEAAELAEIFQWMTPEQSQSAHLDKVVQEHIADEVADVLLYLLQLADHAHIDLKRAVGRKLQKNAKKHPPTRPGLPAGTAAEAGPETHVLVDWENVQPRDADIRELVPDVTDVWVFHGPQQKHVAERQASFGERATCVPIARTGKNALDFHLSFYMGYIASRRPDARFVVLSNDKGYGPMLEHAADLGFSARAVGFGRQATTARATASRKTTRTPAKAPSRVAAKAPAGKVPAGKVPAKKAAAARKTTKAPAAKAKPATLAAIDATPGTPPTPTPTPAPAPAPAKKRATRSATSAKTARSSPPPAAAAPAPAPAPAPAAAAAAADRPLDRDVRHVRQALAKASGKPTRVKALLALVRSMLGAAADDARVDEVLTRLVAAGVVAVDSRGGVRFPDAAPPVEAPAAAAPSPAPARRRRAPRKAAAKA